ncbi:MAG: hypothetical protein EA365_03915 [Gloeocapsa sp. DLM2.Bin57]|nr:MAG: hypothetical protein EA365_03915 [Gloeocapsa sp. DLM2.Bin57]
MSKRILFISNGHGEDNHSSYVIRTLQEQRPDLEIAAMPLVGEGRAYRSLDIPIIGPTQVMPSGGFFYMNPLHLFKDLQAGLVGLTWRQLRAVLDYAPSCDLIMATGDVVSQSFAYLTGLPFISFISCLSSLYEGKLNLGLILWQVLQSSRCQAVFTRDLYTAKDLQQQGLTKTQFGGIPSLDRLIPTGKDLQLVAGQPLVALLPGSRPAEAIRNFRLQLDLVLETVKLPGGEKINFRAALVPGVMNELEAIASSQGWQHENGKLTNGQAQVICYADAFNDIICNCDLVIGMAGLAVDQAVAIGKAVIQIPGPGPQFTYQFAEAQTRLLGISVQTIGTEPATGETLKQAAVRMLETLADTEYLAKCRDNGLERFGCQGASLRITQAINAII